ncbi:hypothetical protein [Luteimonas sp. FCS-9]|uniref:hypothetical protein n=1 Tax=Luteimonas sp. FCS-9 TaxID=1547516 RepID=UPI00063EA562|nr:hypothetical protein [Luteimonas sp. FCS-9]KLJ00569.1 hypothetical protein WQ56_09000 [Luteimonas sp. FCS-9]
MSGISSNAGFSAASLERLGGQVAFDDLRQPQGGGLAGLGESGADAVARGPQADPGEDMLNAAAWDGVPSGLRQFAGDRAFEGRLAGLDLAAAADHGTDAILDALG